VPTDTNQGSRKREVIHSVTVVTDVVVPARDTGAGPAWYVEALRQWQDAATCAGITVSEASYDYTTTDPEADDREACGEVLIGRGWYVVELVAGVLKARHVYDIENDECGDDSE
jgi:hypothetical protein